MSKPSAGSAPGNTSAWDGTERRGTIAIERRVFMVVRDDDATHIVRSASRRKGSLPLFTGRATAAEIKNIETAMHGYTLRQIRGLA